MESVHLSPGHAKALKEQYMRHKLPGQESLATEEAQSRTGTPSAYSRSNAKNRTTLKK